MATEVTRKPSQTIRGVVVSDKMDKTRVISIKRHIKHKLYHKQLSRNNKFKIHDEKNESQKGDLIEAISCRPLSKDKHFRLKSVVEKGKVN